MQVDRHPGPPEDCVLYAFAAARSDIGGDVEEDHHAADP
jgi:hypothetical protein